MTDTTDLFWRDMDTGVLHLGDKTLAQCSAAELTFGIERMFAEAEAAEAARQEISMVAACDILARLRGQMVV